jgi:hypothetical protein
VAKLTVREADVESALVTRAEKYCGEAVKLNLRGRRGWPDRLVLLPGSIAFFVETKKPGEEPEPLQQSVHRTIRRLGFDVVTVDTVEDARIVVDARARG